MSTPETRQSRFFSALNELDLRNDLPQDVIALIQAGDQFNTFVEPVGSPEPLAIRALRGVL